MSLKRCLWWQWLDGRVCVCVGGALTSVMIWWVTRVSAAKSLDESPLLLANKTFSFCLPEFRAMALQVYLINSSLLLITSGRDRSFVAVLLPTRGWLRSFEHWNQMRGCVSRGVSGCVERDIGGCVWGMSAMGAMKRIFKGDVFIVNEAAFAVTRTQSQQQLIVIGGNCTNTWLKFLSTSINIMGCWAPQCLSCRSCLKCRASSILKPCVRPLPLPLSARDAELDMISLSVLRSTMVPV